MTPPPAPLLSWSGIALILLFALWKTTVSPRLARRQPASPA